MPYLVLEAMRPNGDGLRAEEAVLLPAGTETKPLGAYPTWRQTLRAVARVEAQARKERPGCDLALVIVGSRRRPD